MDTSSGVLRGRPHGGTAILWRKDLGGGKVIETEDSRFMCFEFLSGSAAILFINSYMPCDSADNLDEFLYYLAKVNSVIDNHPSLHSCIIGDFNANFSNGCKSLFGKELSKFCEHENFVIADRLLCVNNTFTFFSEAHNSVSWLDHVIVSNNLFDAVSNINVDNSFITSDHFPMSITFDVSYARVDCGHFNNGTSISKVPWDRLSKDDLCNFKQKSDYNLQSVILNHSLLLCDDVNCKDPAHSNAIDRLYNDIKDSLLLSSQELIKERGNTEHSQIAGWREYCSVSHADARQAFTHWVRCSKPRHGPVFEQMRRTRAYFKYTLRQCHVNQERVKSDNLARKLLSKQSKQFWKEVSKLKGGTSAPLAFTIEDTSGQKNICDMWKGHYKSILNSSKDTPLKQDILNKLQSCTSSDAPFTPAEIVSVIKELKNGKASGRDGLQSEHFKYGSDKLNVLLCLLFNCMVLHGYVCEGLMDTILIPIVKDKKGNIASKDNYRPIAITSVISKIFEAIILSRYQYCLITCHNQFGFKEDHSTDMCLFSLKQVVDYYSSLSSPVFICYLDASKAFDRLNFWVLFDKLLKRGLPIIIICLLVFWYANHQFVI
jgi:hypothetical protein